MKKKPHTLLLLLAASMLFSAPAQAAAAQLEQATAQPISMFMDGRQLQSETPPVVVNGSTLVPIRGIFEAQGAKLSWNDASKTVTATKGSTTLTYRLGDTTALLDGQTLLLSVPGQITNGFSLVPLRFVSEALGSTVKWEPNTKSIWITSPVEYETSIAQGVNLRTTPDSQNDTNSLGLLPVGEKVHVIREVNALWLEVQTKNNQTGYISAKPKYTDYSSPALIQKQGSELIAAGSKYLGTPYEFGATSDQTKTFDCSSFVKRVFGDTLSIELPRVSYDQAKVGKEVKLDDLRVGDLLFFTARKLDIGHVAIYAGNNQILHTYSKEKGVHFEAFEGQWKKRFVTARRVF
ncbi:stalk domain-containing protein [Paenibacillus guangzhouensis]|uniref:stalk domain-containing protein n=1 Tax=Paenibacillus guangzhouensis TaxID=1473112 RepID=UPI0012676EA1|nr:stalk domain-containing protein [Paenibacillus guangzhouensis]